ncbi:MerR family transcriptional regulator [Mangrovicella endophytica]|uniref:MerR family transcriptional regulator n=1 Tax=Mangrovicella endophytica TaxID=2066697 RepID=UPI000C9EAA4A|nr:MerR family transcriptional regulator [Mangrovicella endophytica]
MSEKSIDAFRTISEVAEDLDLPQHVLRFWETRFPQIKPMKRGGGRRFYRPDDVELLKGVRYLLYVKGYTIKGVQRILKESGNRFVMAIGSGDLSVLDSMPAARRAAADDELQSETEADVEIAPQEPHVDDIDLIAIEAAATQKSKGFASVFRREPRAAGNAAGASTLPGESVEKLQSVILDLLECKRLLDQVR